MGKSKYHFERLTPTDNTGLGIYDNAINYVFENEDIKNIAVSGAYGAGKSSVLASYKKTHKDLRFLHISLAHFNSTEQKENQDIREMTLEGKIINQLIHQIPSEKIPHCDFKIKKDAQNINITWAASKATLFFLSLSYFIFFSNLKNCAFELSDNWLKDILSVLTGQYGLTANFLVLFFSLFHIVRKIITIQKNKNIFRKFNIQGTEIEIFEENDDSYFDKYLNEVIYLFEHSDADVIVFEDMDRFNTNKIFERLREINTLVNIQLQNKGKKTLRFFYLLRDDIFISKDRIKFFDFIIPVVPVLNSSNSYDQFISHLEQCEIIKNFDEHFLQNISLYVDEMRLLKNICNEFLIYHNKLNSIELDYNKMLAIITYKNIFPCDFNMLQFNQGFVYSIFAKKEQIILNEEKKLKEQISAKQQAIDTINNEHLQSIEELEIVIEKRRNYTYISKEEQAEYEKRKTTIEEKNNNKIADHEKHITALEQELTALKNKRLKDIITRENIDEIFKASSANENGEAAEFNKITHSEYFDLLKYLIRNGYIDESYTDYISYFYENSLKLNDKKFLRSIADKKAKPYTYSLDDPHLVFPRLKLADFEQEETLNFNLFTYLLQKDYTDYIKKIISQLKSTKNFSFIACYFDLIIPDEAPDLMPRFIQYMNKNWPELFKTAYNENFLMQEKLHTYSVYSLYYSDFDTLKLMNENKEFIEDEDVIEDEQDPFPPILTRFISNSRNYLAITDPRIDRLISCFEFLHVRFVGFNYKKTDKKLFKAVYEKSLYEINAENLELIQRVILGEEDTEKIYHANYSIIYSNSNSTLAQYVNKNINNYFDIVLKMCQEHIFDEEEVALSVLNNKELSRELKKDYIRFLINIITSFDAIDDVSLWPLLIDTDGIEYSEHNIITYYKQKQLDEALVSYINKCGHLDFSNVQFEDENSKKEFFEKIIACNTIENNNYKQIVTSLHLQYDDLENLSIDDDKKEILIDTNSIKMTISNLEFIRERYPMQIYIFIQNDIEEYTRIIDNTLFSQEELLEILTWSIDDTVKIELLQFSHEEISIINKNYSPAICLYILNNNFMKTDLLELVESYEKWDSSIQAKIVEYSKQYPELIENSNIVSDELKKVLSL